IPRVGGRSEKSECNSESDTTHAASSCVAARHSGAGADLHRTSEERSRLLFIALHSAEHCSLLVAFAHSRPDSYYEGMTRERSVLDPSDTFAERHIGPDPDEIAEMLGVVGCESLEALVGETIPEAIRLE